VWSRPAAGRGEASLKTADVLGVRGDDAPVVLFPAGAGRLHPTVQYGRPADCRGLGAQQAGQQPQGVW